MTKAQAKLLVDTYTELVDEERSIKERKEEIVAKIQEYMKESGEEKVLGAFGKLTTINKKKYTWSLEDVKEIYPKSWQLFVLPDNKALKALSDKDTVLLEKAQVEESSHLTFTRA